MSARGPGQVLTQRQRWRLLSIGLVFWFGIQAWFVIAESSTGKLLAPGASAEMLDRLTTYRGFLNGLVATLLTILVAGQKTSLLRAHAIAFVACLSTALLLSCLVYWRLLADLPDSAAAIAIDLLVDLMPIVGIALGLLVGKSIDGGVPNKPGSTK